MAKRAISGLAFFASSAATLLLSGGAGAAEERLQIPEEVISQVLDEAEKPGWDTSTKRRLIQLLAGDPRPSIRAQAADVVGNLGGTADAVWIQGLLHTLAQDPDEMVRLAASHSLAQRLGRLPKTAAMSCAMEWAHASDRLQRECLARALTTTQKEAWNERILEQLITDNASAVRQAATRALARRYQAEPDTYGWLLSAALTDTDVRVRRLAQRVASGRAV